MDSVNDILSSKNFDEPEESVAIKKFIQNTYQETAEVIVREKEIIISVASSSLASSLRMKVPEIKKAARTTKRLAFRIR